MQKIPKQKHTAEFKEHAVSRAREAGIVGVASREMGLGEDAAQLGQGSGGLQTQYGRREGGDTRGDELSRLRAQNARLQDACRNRRMHREVHWIDAQRRDYQLRDMCRVLSVSISGYLTWHGGRPSDSTQLNDAQARGDDQGDPC